MCDFSKECGNCANASALRKLNSLNDVCLVQHAETLGKNLSFPFILVRRIHGQMLLSPPSCGF